jgi:hypothetical protein
MFTVTGTHINAHRHAGILGEQKTQKNRESEREREREKLWENL